MGDGTMKKAVTVLYAVIFSVTLLFSTLVTGVYALEDVKVPAVSIALGTGEVQLNGKIVDFEMPYSVDGVVLAPVDLIAEAFDVSYNISDDGNTLVISHPEVGITLENGSTLADVNEIPQTLSVAPEYKNDVFMVPLRFVCETFGAQIEYVAETGNVMVNMPSVEDEGSIIKGGIESAKIGDSKFSWSMENTSDLPVDDHRADGSYTRFVSEDYEKSIIVRVDELGEKYDFETDYYTRRYGISDNTLLYVSKDDSNPNKKTIRIKEKFYGFEDTYVVVTDKYYYEVVASCESDSKEQWETMSRIVSSFDTVFNKEDTHDLYKEKSSDKYELFESEELNLSLELPGFFDAENVSNYDNVLHFESEEEDNEYSGVTLYIYAKEDGIDAKKVAEIEHKFNLLYINEKISKVSENVTEANYENITGYEYDILCEGKYVKSYARNLYFEVGDYIYCLGITLELPNDKAKKQADYLLNSLKANPIEDEEFDKIIYNVPEFTGNTYICSGKDWQISLPEGYIGNVDSYYTSFSLGSGHLEINAEFNDTSIKSFSDIKALFDEFKELGNYYDKFEIIQPLRKVMIGNNQYFEMAFNFGDEDSMFEMCYTHFLATYRNGRAVVFGIECFEPTYSQKAIDDMYEIAKSLKFDKK